MFIKKERDGRVKDDKIIINKGFSKNHFGSILDTVMEKVVVFSMFLYLVLLNHVDLVVSVKFMINTFLN